MLFRSCKKSKKLAGNDCPEKDVQEIVYLIKDESITQNNKSGDPVTSYYSTKDTPYILPKNLENSVCTSHKPDPDPKPDKDLSDEDDKPIQIPDPVDDEPIEIDDPTDEEEETGNEESDNGETDAHQSKEETTGQEENGQSETPDSE